ncbi:MAG: hypothetical protein WC635_16645 [Bacteriovorax sp.]
MKIVLCFILLITFGCSWTGVRTPSAKSTAVSIEDVFSVEASAETGSKDFKQFFVDSMNFVGKNEVKFEYIQSSQLSDKTAFKIELDIVKDKYIYRIFHSKNAFKDTAAIYELGVFFQKIKDYPMLSHKLSVFEMYYNAQEGDIIAIDNFLKIRSTKEPNYTGPTDEPPDNFLKRSKVYEDMRKDLAPEIKDIKSERKALEVSRKNTLDKLDKAPEGKQFRALVAQGDRNGAAELLKKYLPFEDMAPFEKRFWETHLAVMRKPVPLDQRVLIYRGLNDDFIHSAYDGAEELSKSEAIKESKAFVMSPVLVKNQGSWNRRLRSLEAMNEKFIATIENSSEYAQSARISTMFLKHAQNPQGSPFISFTPKLGVAQSFGNQQLMSALIDPRLIHFNYVSNFDNEIEFLLPLATFPDDMVGLWTSDQGPNVEDFLNERLKVRVADEFGNAKVPDIIKRIKKNSIDFFSTVYDSGQKKPTGVKGGSMADFYKKFAKGKDAIKPSMTPKGDLACKDLLKMFWVVP